MRENKEIRAVKRGAPARAKSAALPRAIGVKALVAQLSKRRWDPADLEKQAKLWGIREHTLRHWLHEARVIINSSIDPAVITAYMNEAIDELRVLAADAKKRGETREAIAAWTSILQMVTRLQDAVPEGAAVTFAEVYAEMRARGWQPPRTVPGLPTPSVIEMADGDFDDNGASGGRAVARSSD